MHRLILVWHTLRHLAVAQVGWRLWRMVQHKLRLYRRPRAPLPPPEFDRNGLRGLRVLLENACACEIHAQADINALRGQTFCFLNRRVENRGHIPWSDVALPRLWRYHLHGFVFARDFAVNAAADHYLGDRDRALHWMRDWLAHNPMGADVAWDAYPVSERLLHWALLCAVFSIQEEDIRAACFRQMAWLSRHLEYDIRANHLLKNACALLVAATLLQHDVLRQKARTLLQDQLQEQILEDGGHYERSPMYHALVLWDLLTVHAACGDRLPGLSETLTRMTDFLEKIVHPDGEIPLFGDAAWKEAPPTQALIALARRHTATNTTAPATPAESTASTVREPVGAALPASGFYLLGAPERRARMIVKTAPPSPPFQPGHSHADLFSFELSVGPYRMLVDSGVDGYAESALRARLRGTAAHNTVQVNGWEQSECWGVFRVARRPQCELPRFEVGEEHASLVAACRHYAGYRHERRILFSRTEMCWEMRDEITLAHEPIHAVSRLHPHPDCTLERNGNSITLRQGDVRLRIEPGDDAPLLVSSGTSGDEGGWHCPEFGVALPAQTLAWAAQGRERVVLTLRATLL